MRGTLPPLPQDASGCGTQLKHRDKFTFTFTITVSGDYNNLQIKIVNINGKYI
jgi:hypothetical protein